MTIKATGAGDRVETATLEPCPATFPQPVLHAAVADEQWRALATVPGGPVLAADPRFADLCSRPLHEEALDAMVREWAADQDAAKAVDALRAAGVPAEQVLHVDEAYRCGPAATPPATTTRRSAPARCPACPRRPRCRT